VVWLENYLTNWDRTLLVVSHNRDFLNNVTQQTIHFVNKQLTYYKGNYDNFESVCHPLRLFLNHLLLASGRFRVYFSWYSSMPVCFSVSRWVNSH